MTGGTGAVGGQVARWAAGRGAARVVLASRSGPGAGGVADLAAGLARAGTTVQVHACDAAERDRVSALLARLAAGGSPVTAVLHAAGAAQAIPVDQAAVGDLAGMLAAKAVGAAHLDELTAGMDLDAFVLFSSVSATWGAGGQPGYAAANAYLDALAGQRRARGRRATSVAWGPWDGDGMATGESGAQLRRHGLGLLDPARAVQALGQAVDGGEETVTVADVDWARFAPAFTLRRPSPLLQDLPVVAQALASAAASASAGARTGPAGTGLAERLAGLPRADQDQVLTDLVRAEAAAVLGHSSPEAVEPVLAFSELGFDSLTAVELRNRLNAATGLLLPATLVFDYPTAVILADYLRGEICPGEAAAKLPVLAELDQLESVLSAVTADSDMRTDITVRLQTILSRWIGREEVPEANSVADKLQAASAGEVLDFIENELGVS